MTYAAVGLLVVAAAQGGVLVWLARRMQALTGLEQRVARLGEALTLLTDTTECGFRTVAERTAVGPAPRARAPRGPRATVVPVQTPQAVMEKPPRQSVRRNAAAAKRVARAARRGRTVEEIAAAEQVSEGEVRLTLHVADAKTRTRAKAPAALSA